MALLAYSRMLDKVFSVTVRKLSTSIVAQVTVPLSAMPFNLECYVIHLTES